MKMPTASKITRKSVKITGKAAGGKKLTIYAVSRNKNKKSAEEASIPKRNIIFLSKNRKKERSFSLYYRINMETFLIVREK